MMLHQKIPAVIQRKMSNSPLHQQLLIKAKKATCSIAAAVPTVNKLTI